MLRKLLPLAGLLLIASLLAVPGAGATPPAAAAADSEAPIRLQAATFTPARGERPDIPPGLTIAGYAAGRAGYYLVQFAGPVREAWKDQVAALGGELLDYIPDFAFKVRMTPAAAARAEALDAVAWVGLYHPAYKLGSGPAGDGSHLYRVRIERGADAGRATAAVAATGATVLQRHDGFLLVGADGAQLEAIARVLDVAWVEKHLPAERHNEFGAGVTVGANVATANGYDGSTQIVAVSDTGLGDGTAAGAHPDIPASRISSIYNWPGAAGGCFTSVSDDGPRDVDSGHGTHTAVSVLGDGGPAGEGKGAAPAAGLVFQATENWATIDFICQLFGGWPAQGYFLTGLPDDLGDMYQQAYADGARVHSNSWGSAQAGAYTIDSANTDDFMWNNPDMAITFSAGNEGYDFDLDGVVDADSLGSPATAKNVITVGASEGDRQGDYQCDAGLTYPSADLYQAGQTCASMGGNQAGFLGTAGERWGFLVEPLAGDVSAGDAEQMAPFSSRGPTDDNRIKPDVVAPGTWILSGFSGLHQQGYGDPVNPQTGGYQWDGWGMPANSAYKYMGGTSMSNPIAAGGAAVVRDFYQKAHSHGASAALVKATLINSAVDLADENNDGVDDNDFPIPNLHEGWGRIDLAAATDGSHQFVEEAVGPATGGSATYQFGVASPGGPFKATLVWSDFPSTEAAAANLVNDLDLVVTAPGGAQYRGNHFAGGWSQADGAPDRVNNVENVYVPSASAGTWTVQVQGFNVPNGPQPFALVVDGDLAQPNDPPTVALTGPADGSTVQGTTPIEIDAADAEDPAGSLTVEWNVDGGAWQEAAYDSGTGSYHASWDTTTVGDGSHTVDARATDSAANVAGDSSAVTVHNAPVVTVHVGDLDGAASPAPRNRWNASVTITVHDASEVSVAGATVDGSWSNGGGGWCTTDASGRCTITEANIKGSVASVTFTVVNVTRAPDSYDPGANHDPDGDGTVIVVFKDGPPPNQPPVASFTYSCADLVCTFDGAPSSDPDGTVSGYDWDFGDGAAGTGVATSHTYAAAGTYTVVLTVTDDQGATDTDSQSVPAGMAAVQMHVGDLDGAAAAAPRNRWNATVTITVHDAAHAPVPGATVEGSWSDGANGGGSCSTDASGRCTITKNNIKGNTAGATFTVDTVSRAADSYDAGANHDPDGDSDGTTITISGP